MSNLRFHVMCTHAHGSLSDCAQIASCMSSKFLYSASILVTENTSYGALETGLKLQVQMTKVGGFCGLTWDMNFPAKYPGHLVVMKVLFSSDPGALGRLLFEQLQ